MKLVGLSGPNDTPVQVEILGITQDERVGEAHPDDPKPKNARKDDGNAFMKMVAAIGVTTMKSNFTKPDKPPITVTCPDGLFLGHEFKLRRERTRPSNGRIYRGHFEATAVDGSVCQGVAKACVPAKDPLTGDLAGLCIEDDFFYDSTTCEAPLEDGPQE